MDFILKFSLEDEAFVTIAAALWNQKNIRDMMPISYYNLKGKWQEIENSVIENTSKIMLPKALKKKLLHFVRQMGLQIPIWVHFHEENCCSLYKFPKEFFWTSQGFFDKKKTTEVLVTDESIPIYQRFKLACFYCLEDDIRTLWIQLQPCRQNLKSVRESKSHLVIFWPHYIEGKMSELNSILRYSDYNEGSNITPYEYGFQISAKACNEVATKYFAERMTPQDMKNNLLLAVKHAIRNYSYSFDQSIDRKIYTDVLCFLLSVSDKEYTKKIFKKYSWFVLQCLLDWPWQSLFLRTVNCIWEFIDQRVFCILLRGIVNKMSHTHDHYHDLFTEFWLQSPAEYTRFFSDRKFTTTELLTSLLTKRDKSNFKLVAKVLTSLQKNYVIFHAWGRYYCKILIFSKNFDMVKFLIEECISSKLEMIKFKEEWEKYHEKRFEGNDPAMYKFLKLLDDCIKEL